MMLSFAVDRWLIYMPLATDVKEYLLQCNQLFSDVDQNHE